MPRLPRLTSEQTIRVLERIGFARARSSGSHIIFVNPEGRRVTVAAHAGKTLHPKVLKSILNDAGLTVERLLEILND